MSDDYFVDDEDFLIRAGNILRHRNPTLTKEEAEEQARQLDSAIKRNDLNFPGRKLKMGWVNDPALPYWRIEARGILAKNGEEIIRRFWIRKGRDLGARQVVVGPASWTDHGYTVSGVELPEGVDISTWNIDEIITYIDTEFPLKKTRSDVDRVRVYQESYSRVGGLRRAWMKNAIQQSLLLLYFGWREVMIQMERDPQNFDDFSEGCGYKPDNVMRLLTGKAKRATYTVDLLVRACIHMSWFMCRYNGPIILLEVRPDYVMVPVWVWPDEEMNEVTADVIFGARIRHQSTHDQGHWVRWPNRYRSYWSDHKQGGSNLPIGGEVDIRPAVTWNTNQGSAGEFDFVQIRPEVKVVGRLLEPTEWEEITEEDITRVVKTVYEMGAFEFREFADAVGTSQGWLRRLFDGEEKLTMKELRLWMNHLKPYYCPRPEIKTVRRNTLWKWRMLPYEPDTRLSQPHRPA